MQFPKPALWSAAGMFRGFPAKHRAKCESVAPANGRQTPRASRERAAAERKTAAILGKHGL